MNNLKIGVLACGVLGLIGVFLPMVSMGSESMSLWGSHTFPGAAGQVYMVMAGYVLGIIGGGMAVMKAPMLRWQSILATVGFAFVLFKFRDGLPFELLKGAIGAKLMGIAAYAGAIFSVLTLVKPEAAAK